VLDHDQLAPHGVKRWAAHDANQIAVQHTDGSSLTYGELHHDALVWANALQQVGVGPGTHVATLLHNSFDAHRTLLALGWLRATEVPLNTAYAGRMLQYTLDLADASVLVTSTTWLDQIEAVTDQLTELHTIVLVDGEGKGGSRNGVDVLSREQFLAEPAEAVGLEGPEVWDTACLLFTSGTTGPSKAVVTPWGLSMQMTSWMPDDTVLAGESIYCAMPLFHNSGRSVFNFAVTRGARFVMRDKFSATNVWAEVRRYHCVALCLVGPMTALLYSAPPRDDDADNPLRSVICGPMFPEIEEFERRFGVKVATCYGQTEIGSPVATGWDHGPWANCGRARESWPWHEVRLVNEHDEPVPVGESGEMAVRSPEPWSLNLGYYKMPEQTVKAWRNGWFHTGDVFKQDEDGWYYFVDRVHDVIRRRAENISSFEVENYVLSYEDVIECTAIGIRTELGDEEVMACVIVRDPSSFDPVKLLEYLEGEMPRFMLPRYVEVLDDFPRNETTARVRKRELRDRGVTATTWDREA
jgi:crotonobetaine/carnitine-CoA ligase